MKRLLLLGMLLGLLAGTAQAQITVPNTLVDGTTISATPLNTNFATIANHSLDRLTGGNIAGNVTVDALITIDGVDVGVQACVTCTPTFAKVTTSNTSATSLTVGGGITAGTGAVAIVDATGKIPALSATYFTSLANISLTGATINFLTYSETKTAPTISASALTLDLSLGTHFTVALNSAATITISNYATTGRAGAFTVAFTADGTLRALTWPAAVKWAGGVAPTMTSTNGKVDIIQCLSYTAGTTTYCAVMGQGF